MKRTMLFLCGAASLCVAAAAVPSLHGGEDDAQKAGKPGQRLLIPWGQKTAAEAMPAFPAPPSDATDSEAWEDWNAEVQAWQEEFDAWLGETLESHDDVHAFGMPLRFQNGGFDPEQMEAWAQQWEDFGHHGAQSSSSVRKMEMSVDEDGKVHVKVERDEDGERSEETFEADSMEAFQQEHPEVAQELGMGNGVMLRGFDGLGGFRVETPGAWQFRFPGRAPMKLRKPMQPQAPMAPMAPEQVNEGPKLGVHIETIEADNPLRGHLDLDADIGLLVTDVVEDSLAERLGIEPMDILLQIGATDIGSADDVRTALEAAGDGDVEVTVLRRGRTITLQDK